MEDGGNGGGRELQSRRRLGAPGTTGAECNGEEDDNVAAGRRDALWGNGAKAETSGRDGEYVPGTGTAEGPMARARVMEVGFGKIVGRRGDDIFEPLPAAAATMLGSCSPLVTEP